MRRVSKKRRKRLKEVEEFRVNFRAEIGRCELCGRSGPVLHEISRGQSRSRSLDQRSCLLAVCHVPCHEVVGKWPRSKQLALLRLRRPTDFSLEVFYRITARRYPDLEDILHWVQVLKEELP